MADINHLHIDRLVFRRQFLLGPKPFLLNSYWSSYKIGNGLFLSIHCDLSYESINNNEKELIILGSAFDPYHPQFDNKSILRSLFKKSTSLMSLIEATKPLAGRWILLLNNRDGTFLFSDPCGFRQAFYTYENNQIWCGSQPEIIKQNCSLQFTEDPKIISLLLNQDYSEKESSWPGNQTVYKNCYHLMPNHFLDINNGQQIRFYPNKPFQILDNQEIISSVSKLLLGIIESITNRYDVKFALTSGWDSRLLLAASKNKFKNIEFFIDRKDVLPIDHPDVVIPDKLAKTLNFKFIVKNSVYTLPGWFISLLSYNITGARILPKTQMIYDYLIHGEERVNINGNGGEVFRNLYDNFYENLSKEVELSEMIKAFGYRSQPDFVLSEFKKWSDLIRPYLNDPLYLLDFLHWEQRLGNWGAQFPAEQDIAIEEVSPLNCRELYDIMLSSPRNLRGAPDYSLIKDLIKFMWPEVIIFPFNKLVTENLDNKSPDEFKVSIIIPVFNAENFLKMAVESALIQPETSEIILVEDGSSDLSLKICKEIVQENKKVKLFQHKDGKNLGAAASRNLGIKNSSCDYIAFLDADDFFLPERFKITKEILSTNPKCEGVYEAAGIHFDDEQAIRIWQQSQMANVRLTTMNKVVPPENLFEVLACEGSVGYFSIIGLTIKKSIIERSGYFNEDLLLHQDTDFIFRLTAVGDLLPGNLEEPVVIRRVHKNNRISSPKTEKQKYRNQAKAYRATYIWCKRKKYLKERQLIFDIIFSIYNNKISSWNFLFIDNEKFQEKVRLLLWLFEFPAIITDVMYWKKLFPKIFLKIQTSRHTYHYQLAILMRFKILLKFNKDVKLLRSSNLFDKTWYLVNNPDVAKAKVNPYEHYLFYGGFEGRNPSLYFDTKWYLDNNLDVKNSHINPLLHYLKFGKDEGRKPQKEGKVNHT